MYINHGRKSKNCFSSGTGVNSLSIHPNGCFDSSIEINFEIYPAPVGMKAFRRVSAVYLSTRLKTGVFNIICKERQDFDWMRERTLFLTRFWDQVGQQCKVDTVVLCGYSQGQTRTARARVQTVYGVTLHDRIH